MLKYKILTIGFLFLFYNTRACDFCTILDYGNINNRSFVKVDYRFAQYKKYNQMLGSSLSSASSSSAVRQGLAAHGGGPDADAEYFNSDDDYERFVSLNLGFNYALKERYNISLNIPVFFNSHSISKVVFADGHQESQLNKGSGLGDISIGLQRFFIIEKDKMKHTFKLGGNLYLPTGDYEVGNLLTENVHLQPGRSIYALDILGSYNIENVGVWGVNIFGNYYVPFNKNQFNTQTSLSYKFAKKYTLDVNAYRIFNGSLTKVILVGLKNELNKQESVNEILVDDTGFYGLYTNLGATVSKDRFLARVETNLPLFQSFNGLQLKNQVKFSVSLMYYLNKTKE